MTTHFMYMSHLSLLLLVLFYLPVCLGVLWFINFILRKIPLWKALRVGVCLTLAVPMFLWPTWDAILGKHYLDQLCEKDGGTYILSDVQVDGLFTEGRPREDLAQQMFSMGFRYVETGMNGAYVRYSLDEHGTTIEKTIPKILSPYRFGSESRDVNLGPDYLTFSMSTIFLEDVDSGERLGGYRNYYFFTRFDKKLEGIGSLPATRCNDIPKFKSMNRFKDQSRYIKLLGGLKN